MTGPRLTPVPTDALRHLREVDPVLGSIIDRVGPVEYQVEPDLWRSLVGSIVGQQLSLAAARTIRSRVAALGSDGFPTPEEILELPPEVLRECGLSRAKAIYVRDAAVRFHDGEMDPATIQRLGDEEVIASLVRTKGVGRWTAEMVLIFCLARPDVLSVDDLGIRVAAQRAFGLPERPGRAELQQIGEKWRPFRSFASLYLWRSLESE